MKDKNMEDVILNAALEVVDKNTISGTRMHLIAQKAGMAQSNIHYHYKTKRNLMVALHRKVVNRYVEIRDNIRGEYGENLSDQLEIFFRQKLDTILKEPEYDTVELDFWLQARIDEEYHETMNSAFDFWRRGIGEIIDKYVPDMPASKRAFLPHMIISLLEGATLQYHVDEEHFDVEAYLGYCKEIVLGVIYDL